MTIKDIAELCGVSVSTVSRVLNDHPDVSKENREKVLAIVREMHYVPNNSARDLVKPTSDAIGLVVRGVGNPFFTDVIQAIENAVTRSGYTLVLHQIQSGDDELRAAAELAQSKRLLGVILLGGCFDYTPEQTAALNVPFVCCTYTNRFGTLEDSSYSSVCIDDRTEARKAVSLLTGQGHRRIGILLDSTHDHSISQLRYRGYCQALDDCGITADPALVEETVGFDMPSAYSAAKRLMARCEDMTAMFVISDAMAVAAMKAINDCGKRVPEDCSVVAIDGIELSAYSVPTLTTLVQPQRELGKQAVHILVDMIENDTGNRHVLLETTTRAGGSICAPRL